MASEELLGSVYLGSVTDEDDTEVKVYREDTGAVVLWAPDIGWSERFEAPERDKLRELLDRAAMPGVRDGGDPPAGLPGRAVAAVDAKRHDGTPASPARALAGDLALPGGPLVIRAQDGTPLPVPHGSWVVLWAPGDAGVMSDGARRRFYGEPPAGEAREHG